MVTIKQQSLDDNYTYRDLVMLDTKLNILDSFEALDLHVSKNLRKGELADMLATLFDEKPFYIIDHLPKEEQELLSELIGCQQNEPVIVPETDHPLALQKHHLVVSVVDGTKRKLFMPDAIRKHIDNSAMQDLSVYPGIQEWKEILEKLNHLQQRIEADVKQNPMNLPIQELPLYRQILQDEIRQLDSCKARLKKLENQISKYNIDFTGINSSINESKLQCDTKLRIMDMFKWE